jgi:hypothetical protein
LNGPARQQQWGRNAAGDFLARDPCEFAPASDDVRIAQSALNRG